jgi:hypothetical protein
MLPISLHYLAQGEGQGGGLRSLPLIIKIFTKFIRDDFENDYIYLCQASLGSHEGVVRGRVVYLSPPDDPLAPVTAGTAVIHTGEFLGQRVEFDRSVCVAYGFPLAKANLSHIITTGREAPSS